MMKPRVSLVITDLDNTLWDWVEIWYAGFDAMLNVLIARSGLPRDVLESEIKSIFQFHGTSEYAFLIQEMPSLQALHPGEDLTIVYAEAVDEFRRARRAVLRLYPEVVTTLEQLGQVGCPVVAYTESMWFYTMTRLKKLGLDGLIHSVYSPPDHAKPADLVRYYDESHYQLEHTIHRNTPPGELKPNPEILRGIVHDFGANPDCTVYVGDSPLKDINMAQDAGVIDVHARYGLAQHTAAYDVLRRVTHWSTEDVEREKKTLVKADARPTFVLESSFSGLLELFEFTAPRKT